jgi:hypothetical protein
LAEGVSVEASGALSEIWSVVTDAVTATGSVGCPVIESGIGMLLAVPVIVPGAPNEWITSSENEIPLAPLLTLPGRPVSAITCDSGDGWVFELPCIVSLNGNAFRPAASV